MSNILKSTTDFVGNTAQQGVSGVQAGGKFVGDTASQGVQGVGKGATSGFNALAGASPGDKKPQEPKQEPEVKKDDGASQPPAEGSEAQKPEEKSAGGGGGGLVGGITGAIGSGVNTAGKGLQAGAGALGDVTKAGFSIGEKVAKTGADMTGNIVMSSAGLAGTAVGGVINTVVDTTGQAFDPVVAGLKSIEGLQGLANNLEKINGLPMAAVKQVGSWTFQAMNMSGKTPTFFDTDGDGIVRVADTIRGLIVLGLEEKNATYAAYVLHGVFTYPTSDSWVPSLDTALPIHINKMDDTRWGKKWGSFDRIEWCNDMDVETFFEAQDESKGTIEKWKETLTKGRQGFGVLLLLFEWGTTWPFMLPTLPAGEIPFKDDIGKVVRTVILPTIFKNWQKSHGIEPDERSEPIPKQEIDLNKEAKPEGGK